MSLHRSASSKDPRDGQAPYNMIASASHRLRLAPWNSRKLARSVRASWRLALQRPNHMQVQVVWFCHGSRHEAPTDRASLRLLHGARRRPTQGACLSLPLALRWRVLAASSHARVCGLVFCDGSRHDAPTDRASLRLLHGARRRPTQGACLSLPLALQRRVLAATTRHHARGTCKANGGLPLQRAAGIKLRLIQQACGCFTVRGGGGLKVRARLLCWHSGRWRVLVAATKHLL